MRVDHVERHLVLPTVPARTVVGELAVLLGDVPVDHERRVVRVGRERLADADRADHVKAALHRFFESACRIDAREPRVGRLKIGTPAEQRGVHAVDGAEHVGPQHAQLQRAVAAHRMTRHAAGFGFRDRAVVLVDPTDEIVRDEVGPVPLDRRVRVEATEERRARVRRDDDHLVQQPLGDSAVHQVLDRRVARFRRGPSNGPVAVGAADAVQQVKRRITPLRRTRVARRQVHRYGAFRREAELVVLERLPVDRDVLERSGLRKRGGGGRQQSAEDESGGRRARKVSHGRTSRE